MKKNSAFLITALLFLAILTPLPTAAIPLEGMGADVPMRIPSCEDYTRNERNRLISACRSANLRNPAESDYCARIDWGTGQQLCEFANPPQRNSCMPRQGAVGLLCERAKAANDCSGECLETSSTFHAAPVEEIKFEPTLPRLQIDIPGLQPFTKASLKTTEEDDRVLLDINFIGLYLVALYKYLVGISGIVAGIMIVWAGLNWLTSAGSPDKIGEAKKKIAGAVVGLILVLGSYIILQILNPELVIFKPLQVEYIKQELLAIDSPLPDIEASDTPQGVYDSLFQKYANCSNVDWRVLRMVAQKESGLRASFVNRAGFIGLFQAKPQYCGLPEQFKDRCTEEQLTNPAVGIAVGAIKISDGLKLVEKYCGSGEPRLQFAIVYSANSSGRGGTEKALKYAQALGGCTVDNVRAGFINFWKQHKAGATARWFINYHGPSRCASYADPLDCMGAEKFNYTLKAGDTYVAQGGGAIKVPATAPCPLNTNDPFPSS